MKDEKTKGEFRFAESKSKDGFFLILYMVAAIGLLFTILLHRRSYQDAWVLDSILIPTVIFIFFTLVVETFVRDNRLIAVLGAAFLVMLNLIPGLKYQMLYGCYDSVQHYGYVNQLVSSGFVPKTGFYAQYYSDIPGMHVFLGSLSSISGIPVNEIFKFILPAVYGIFPLVILFITNGIFDEAVQRYVVIASSFPIFGFVGYVVTGTTFALILYSLFIAVFLRRAFRDENKVEYSLILIILAFSLILSHGVTPFFLSFLLLGMTFTLKSLKFMKKKFPSRSLIHGYIATSSFFIVLLMMWWAFKAKFYLNVLADMLKRIFVVEAVKGPIPTRFFEIPLLAQIKFLAVFYLKAIIIVTLGIFGLFVLIGKFKRKELADNTKDFYFNLLLVFSIISTVLFSQFVISFGEMEYSRFIFYAMMLSPFLVGLALWRLDKTLTTIFRNGRKKNVAFASIMFILFCLCLIQVFSYQPMVPRANILSKDLSEDEYLLDLGMVNTIYQKEMISHAERYSPFNAKIASDRTTRFQIYGLTNASFSSKHIWYSPLEHPNLEWNLFLLHIDEIAGPFNEKAEYRSKERISEFLETGNAIYHNGMSVIMSTNSS